MHEREKIELQEALCHCDVPTAHFEATQLRLAGALDPLYNVRQDLHAQK